MEVQCIAAEGSHFDIGCQVGKAAAPKIASALKAYENILAARGKPIHWGSEIYLSAAMGTFPHLVEEIRGLAAGSGQDFQKLFLLNSLEEALDERAPDACTCLVMKTKKGIFLGHNEDWYAFDKRHVVAIYARPTGKPAFISVTAAPFLAAVGMNEYGIAQGVNSVTSKDARRGIPRMFCARAVLEARDMREARDKALPSGRAGGYNHMLASRDGIPGSLETSAGQHSYLSYEYRGVHTNHYLSAEMVPLEGGSSPSSRARYEQGCSLLSQASAVFDPAAAIRTALKDHANGENAICRHDCQDGGNATIFSVLFDLQNNKAWALPGNPCQRDYQLIFAEGRLRP